MFDTQFWETQQLCFYSADSPNQEINQEIKNDIFLENLNLLVYLHSQSNGSLAQLVQSTCLTSRGSLVRTQ